MKSKLFIPVIALTFLFASCERENSADVNQDRIYTIYVLVYEHEQDVTYARGWFRFGSATGTLLKLSDPSYISFNDQDLGFQEVFAYYENNMSGLVSSGTFHWEDYEGKEFDNSVEIKEIAFPDDLTEINGDSSYELEWVGKALETNEYVAVAINGDFEGDASILTQNTNGSTSIVIPKSNLESLPKNQKATFWMEFGYKPELVEKTSAGGEIYGKYRVMKEIMIK